MSWSARMAARAYWNALLRIDIERHGVLPPGPKIIAANHPSTTDPFLMMGMTSEPISILIREMFFTFPVLGHYLRGAGHVPVIDDNGRPAFDRAVGLLRAGRTIGIFPEGILSPLEGGVHRARTGVARLALATGAPVIPIGISLRRENLRRHHTTVAGQAEEARWYLHGPYAVTIGEPMRLVGDIEDRAYVRAATDGVMLRISQLAHESAQRVPPPLFFVSWARRALRWALPAE